MIAPVVIFAFNRPHALERLLGDLSACSLVAWTDVIVYVDGPRNDADKPLVDETAAVARKITHRVCVSDRNLGLAASVINGVTAVMREYGRAIVLEDDLRLAPNFLAYMNQMLDLYESVPEVFQIAGFGLKVTVPEKYEADVYMHIRSSSWGWASWQDRWTTIDWQVKDYDKLARNPLAQWRFNRGGSDMYSMLKKWHDGKNSSWAIRFSYAMHKQGRVCVTPVLSLTNNEGFGDDATHCTDKNFYDVKMDDGQRMIFKVPDTVAINASLTGQAVSYYSLWNRFLNGRKWRAVKRLLGLDD